MRILEKQGRVKETENFLDQILGDNLYSDPQDQALYDDHTLSVCTTAALKALDRVQEPGQRGESFLGLNRVRENP